MFDNQDQGEGSLQIVLDAFSNCRHYPSIILRGDMMLSGGQTIKLHCQSQILLNTTAIFIGNAEMKQRPFKGGHIKLDFGLGMIGCGILDLFFLQL